MRQTILFLAFCIILLANTMIFASSEDDSVKTEETIITFQNTMPNLLSGSVGAVVVLFLTQFIAYSRRRREDRKKYITTLMIINAELKFYRNKLSQLESFNTQILEDLETGKIPVVPTYSFFPEHLSQMKALLCQHQRNPELIREVTECHFEICHITERLDHTKSVLRDNINNDIEILNIRGFNKLISKTASLFECTEKLISQAIRENI